MNGTPVAIKPSVIHSVCRTIRGIIKEGFGPNASKTMLCSSTGKLHISSCSITIFKALQISHPIGQLIINAIDTHHKETGDGCKTFIILLEAFFSELVQDSASLGPKAASVHMSSALSQLKRDFLEEIMPQIVCNMAITHTTIAESNYETIKNCIHCIAKTFFASRYPLSISVHLAKLLSDFSIPCKTAVDATVENIHSLLDNFSSVCVEDCGQSPDASRIIQGFIIQRDFAVQIDPAWGARNIKFILMDFNLEEVTQSFAVFDASKANSLQSILAWKSKCVQRFVDLLVQLGINLILSSQNVGNSLQNALNQEGISLIHMIPGEDLEWISKVLKIHITHSCDDFMEFCPSELIAESSSIMPIVVNGRKCIHLCMDSRQGSLSLAQQLLLCASTAGQARQLMFDFQSALKSVLMWVCCDFHEDTPSMRPLNGSAITGGGTFELMLSKILGEKAQTCQDMSSSRLMLTLHKAFQIPPLILLQNSHMANSNKTLSYLLLNASRLCHEHHTPSVDGRTGQIVSTEMLKDVMEPLPSKAKLVVHLLELLQQILRLDLLVPVQRIPSAEESQDESNE